MDAGDLPAMSAFTLARAPRCGERARRVLDGARGTSMASTRYRLTQRVREDATLAHAERRAPHPRDFPTPLEFTHEERAVYAAAASGYVVLFGHVPALALDVPRRAPIDGLGIELAGRPGLWVDTDGGTELRMLRIDGTAPSIPEHQRHAAALLAAALPMPVRVVVADLLSLEMHDDTLTVDDVATAQSWMQERVEVWQEAAGGRAVNHDGCLYCEFVWDCGVHRRDGT